MAAMINADVLRAQLVSRIGRLQREVAQQSGFDGLITVGAMRALAEILGAIDAAVSQQPSNDKDQRA